MTSYECGSLTVAVAALLISIFISLVYSFCHCFWVWHPPLPTQRQRFFTLDNEYGIKNASWAEGAVRFLEFGSARKDCASGLQRDANKAG